MRFTDSYRLTDKTRLLFITSYAAGSFRVTGSKVESGTRSSAGCVYVRDSIDSQTFNIQSSSPTFNRGVNVESTSSRAVYLSGAASAKTARRYGSWACVLPRFS